MWRDRHIFSRFEETINALINSAEVELRYSYAISNEEDIRDELRLRALDAAKAKAEAMVAQLGGTLGRVREISEFGPAEKRTYEALNIPSPPSMRFEQASPEPRTIAVWAFVTFEIE